MVPKILKFCKFKFPPLPNFHSHILCINEKFEIFSRNRNCIFRKFREISIEKLKFTIFNNFWSGFSNVANGHFGATMIVEIWEGKMIACSDTLGGGGMNSNFQTRPPWTCWNGTALGKTQ